MTAPSIGAAPASITDAKAQHDRYAAAILRIEQAAVRAIVTGYLVQLAALSRQARARVVLEGAETAGEQLAAQIEQRAHVLINRREIEQIADYYMQQGADLGQDWATGAVYTLGPANYVPVEPAPDAAAAVRAAVATAEEKLRTAGKLARRARTPVSVETALQVAKGASGNLATGAEYAVNACANDAIRRTAALAGAKVLWVGERDACVICLALSGDTIDPSSGEAFDEFATFDPTRTAPAPWPPGMPLTAPPRHPHCRCFLQVWYGTAAGGLDLPDVLKREALRSVARGWSLPSESNAARARAAEYILRSGLAARLPKSVRAEAERGAAGHFTSRTHPPRRTNVR